tara:strand:- start:335 stop:1468 length:1134 start_codon:yes stop_codon:yes gene_type:complete
MLDLIAALALVTTQAADDVPDAFARHEASQPASGQRIDYETFTGLLRDIVLDVGLSDREAPPRVILTGTRINTANTSRYQFEGNRVAFHLLSDEYEAAITEYRRDLESLPDRIEFDRLSSDEQLAYWLNLHNVAVIEQIMLSYPVTRTNRLEAFGTDEPLLDADILTVAGVPLSLNDIRLRIVYSQWNDPRVMYGFFNGAIGGPNIRRTAYTGSDVWRQLDSNAAEFVNSLRGVEADRNELKISSMYAEGRDYFFPNWPNDVRSHLADYATDLAADEVAAGGPVDASVEEWGVADLINGSRRCTGGSGDLNLLSYSGDYVRTGTPCAAMPANARILINHVIERRLELIRNGAYGRVYVRDVPTVDPDEVDNAEAGED